MPAPDTLTHLSPIWSRSATIIAERGEGAYIHTTDGRKLLDFTSGIGVTGCIAGSSRSHSIPSNPKATATR